MQTQKMSCYDEQRKQRNDRERRLTSTVLIICLSSLACSVIKFALYDLRDLVKTGGRGGSYDSPRYILQSCFSELQFSVNIIIYAARCDQFRKAYSDFISLIFKCKK